MAIMMGSSENSQYNDLNTRLVRLEVEMSVVRTEIMEIGKDVREMRDTITQSKGSFKVISILAATAASIGAIMASVWQKVFPGA